jgi:hypothetical protein
VNYSTKLHGVAVGFNSSLGGDPRQLTGKLRTRLNDREH